ncbi:MAG: nickel pincer cofactor biosynthesis protein LarC [Synechococcus sp. H1_metabat_bins_2.tsv.006]|nr:nickel pincer cofactor biosynthesis protein LarC [Synechococcus sp. H1_metabat_bins_2.tsv.006]
MAANWAYLDLPTGVAGDMLLAALLDLGVPQRVIDEPLAALGLQSSYRLNCSSGSSAGLRGQQLVVELLEASPPHRHWAELKPQLQQVGWPQPLKTKVLEVFQLLADAEAHVHGVAAEQVHFHEVGAIDSLVDVIGVCAGLLHLGVQSLWATPPPAGHGQVRTAHGVLPVPAPAVLEIARRRQLPLASSTGFLPGELTTPTGLALLAVWVNHWDSPPAHTPDRIGVGLGQRQLDRPNLLRLCLPAAAAIDEPAERQTVLVQQCQIDDMDAEALAFLQEQLRAAGALEVFAQPVGMKKGRSGLLLTALALPEQAAALRAIWWQHSSSLGLRENLEQRWVLPRRAVVMDSPWGPVAAKAAWTGRRWRCKPEADALAKLAAEQGLSWAELRAALQPPELEPWG